MQDTLEKQQLESIQQHSTDVYRSLITAMEIGDWCGKVANKIESNVPVGDAPLCFHRQPTTRSPKLSEENNLPEVALSVLRINEAVAEINSTFLEEWEGHTPMQADTSEVMLSEATAKLDVLAGWLIAQKEEPADDPETPVPQEQV